MGLPLHLETLKYAAESADHFYHEFYDLDFGIEQVAAAAEAIMNLPNLKRLTVKRCWSAPLLLSFVARLPATVQVGAAAVSECACSSHSLSSSCTTPGMI
jgi:hypothetical protein